MKEFKDNEQDINIKIGDIVYVNCVHIANRYSLVNVSGHNCKVKNVSKRFLMVLSPDEEYSVLVSKDCIETYKENQ